MPERRVSLKARPTRSGLRRTGLLVELDQGARGVRSRRLPLALVDVHRRALDEPVPDAVDVTIMRSAGERELSPQPAGVGVDGARLGERFEAHTSRSSSSFV